MCQWEWEKQIDGMQINQDYVEILTENGEAREMERG